MLLLMMRQSYWSAIGDAGCMNELQPHWIFNTSGLLEGGSFRRKLCDVHLQFDFKWFQAPSLLWCMHAPWHNATRIVNMWKAGAQVHIFCHFPKTETRPRTWHPDNPVFLGQFFLSCSSLHSVSFFSGFSLLSVPCLHCLQGALPPCLLLGDGGLIQESFAILVNVLRHAKAKHCWNQVLQQNLQVINQYLILFGSSPCTISNKSIAGTILMNLKKELVQNLSTESAWKNLPGLAVIKVQVVHFCGTFAKDLQKQFFHC